MGPLLACSFTAASYICRRIAFPEVSDEEAFGPEPLLASFPSKKPSTQKQDKEPASLAALATDLGLPFSDLWTRLLFPSGRTIGGWGYRL